MAKKDEEAKKHKKKGRISKKKLKIQEEIFDEIYNEYQEEEEEAGRGI